MIGPFSKELLLQSGMLQQQTEYIAIIYKHLGVLTTLTHLYCLLGQSCTVVYPGQGHNRSMRALLQRTTSSELEGHSNKPNVQQWSDSIWEEVLLFFFVPFWCLVFDMVWCCTVLDLVISTYFNHVNGAKCLIHINLCTESDLFPFLFSCILNKNSTRLQRYSCARYKAPGPLVFKRVNQNLNFHSSPFTLRVHLIIWYRNWPNIQLLWILIGNRTDHMFVYYASCLSLVIHIVVICI